MIWSLALHSLRLRPLRTFLTALGIAVAVGSMVIFLSLGEGLRRAFTDHLSNVGPDLQVSFGDFDAASSFSALPELPLSYLTDLQAKSEVYGITSITPLMFYARGGFSPTNSFLFQGTPVEASFEDLYLGFEVFEGRPLDASDATQFTAMIGEQVAQRNNLVLGDVMRLRPEARFEIVGIMRSDGGFIDNVIVVPLSTLATSLDIEERVSYFVMELAEPGRTAEIAEQLREDYPELGFQSASEVLSIIEEGIRITDVVRFGISAIALIVGALAVINTVLMSVFERTKEFGVVRALGAKPRFLFLLVLAESLLLSIVGAIMGMILGEIGIRAVNYFAIDLIGFEVALLTLRLVVFSVAVAMFMGLFSGLLPAARAARIPIAVAMTRE